MGTSASASKETLSRKSAEATHPCFLTLMKDGFLHLSQNLRAEVRVAVRSCESEKSTVAPMSQPRTFSPGMMSSSCWCLPGIEMGQLWVRRGELPSGSRGQEVEGKHLLDGKPLRCALPTIDRNSTLGTDDSSNSDIHGTCTSFYFKCFRNSLDHMFLTFTADSVAPQTAAPARPT